MWPCTCYVQSHMSLSMLYAILQQNHPVLALNPFRLFPIMCAVAAKLTDTGIWDVLFLFQRGDSMKSQC